MLNVNLDTKKDSYGFKSGAITLMTPQFYGKLARMWKRSTMAQ